MFQAPRGTEDVLPEEIPYWTYVEETARRYARLFGYGEIRTPTFEDTGLFARGVGAATDIVEKEMYTFKDKGGNDLTLRPEGTASVVRAYIQHGMHTRPQPVRLFSLISAYRYDRPQAGRLREFHQFNCEAIGEEDPLLDAEIITMAWRFYEGLGLRNLTIALNSIGDSACRPAYLQALTAFYEAHAGEVCPDCQRRLHVNPLRVLDCKNPRCQPVIDEAPKITDYLCDACADHFATVRSALAALALPVQLNPRLVRGLDYYNRTVFEVWPPVVGSQAALGGGGRYDGLVEQLGGRPTPAVGFATGIERIIINLKHQGVAVPAAPAPRVFIVPLGDAAREVATRLADDLRRRGTSSLIGLGRRSLRALLRQANSLDCTWAIILGDQEVATGTATVRHMLQSTEERLPLPQALERVANLVQ
ncbi:MAG TPA: histidine--tRNA ligase [Chloroflexota bacterium]